MIPFDWWLKLWAIAGTVLASGLTVLVLIFIRPPLRSQVDQVTKVKQHSIGWWMLPLFGLGTAAPLLWLALRRLYEMLYVPIWWTVDHIWMLPVLVASAGLVWLAWSSWRQQAQPPTSSAAMTLPPPVAPPARPTPPPPVVAPEDYWTRGAGFGGKA